MKIAAIQMVSSAVVAENLATAGQLIDQAADAGARLVSLPEYFCQIGLHETDKYAIAEPLGAGPVQDFLAAKAWQHQIWLAGGSLPLTTPKPPKVSNTSLLYSPSGEVVARYDKLHLFRYQDGTRSLDESRTMVPGNALVAAQTDLGRVGLTICYDLRFPELVRAMGPVPSGSAMAYLSVSCRPIWQKYSGSDTSRAPASAAWSISCPALARFSATTADDTIWMAAIFMVWSLLKITQQGRPPWHARQPTRHGHRHTPW